MVKIEFVKGGSPQYLDDQQLDIVVNALLHELTRYNEAYDLVCERNAKSSIEYAKKAVYEVFCKINSFTTDEE